MNVIYAFFAIWLPYISEKFIYKMELILKFGCTSRNNSISHNNKEVYRDDQFRYGQSKRIDSFNKYNLKDINLTTVLTLFLIKLNMYLHCYTFFILYFYFCIVQGRTFLKLVDDVFKIYLSNMFQSLRKDMFIICN